MDGSIHNSINRTKVELKFIKSRAARSQSMLSIVPKWN